MCRRCPDAWLEEAEFDQETMERLLHNMVLKILKYFYHVSIQSTDLLEVVVDALAAGPHGSARIQGLPARHLQQVATGPGVGCLEALVGYGQVQDPSHPETQGHEALCNPDPPLLTLPEQLPWKRCCCIGSILLCILAVLLSALLYFIKK